MARQGLRLARPHARQGLLLARPHATTGSCARGWDSRGWLGRARGAGTQGAGWAELGRLWRGRPHTGGAAGSSGRARCAPGLLHWERCTAAQPSSLLHDLRRPAFTQSLLLVAAALRRAQRRLGAGSRQGQVQNRRGRPAALHLRLGPSQATLMPSFAWGCLDLSAALLPCTASHLLDQRLRVLQ